MGPNDITQVRQGDSIWDFADEETMEKEAVKPKTPKVKTAPKPRVKKSTAAKDDNETNNVPQKKPRKSRAKKTDEEGGDRPVAEDTSKQKVLRKPRAKKSVAEGQTKIPKGRVTKSSSDSIPRHDGKTDGDRKSVV